MNRIGKRTRFEQPSIRCPSKTTGRISTGEQPRVPMGTVDVR